jgi:rhamnose utilization protein RhaD (predicted bifunctional aldolase and dehydrogenase)
LRVQGPGGNTSIKDDDIMWIKASGTELANAEDEEIFVCVDRHAAMAEARGDSGDGSCKNTTVDPNVSLRPSIETTFHAALNHTVVAHTHSVATIAHAISPEGREVLVEKLQGLEFAVVGYAKPGLPLTRLILAQAKPETKVFVLQNHGLICCGASVAEVSELIDEVENRLALRSTQPSRKAQKQAPPSGFGWAQESWIARDEVAFNRAKSGTYYPDHTVFLGPALPLQDHEGTPPAILIEGEGILLRYGSTASQRAMLQCLSDVLSRVPKDWSVTPIGTEAEAELLDWDAEKYRQALAAQA